MLLYIQEHLIVGWGLRKEVDIMNKKDSLIVALVVIILFQNLLLLLALIQKSHLTHSVELGGTTIIQVSLNTVILSVPTFLFYANFFDILIVSQNIIFFKLQRLKTTIIFLYFIVIYNIFTYLKITYTNTQIIIFFSCSMIITST